jgi:hypothetical protein
MSNTHERQLARLRARFQDHAHELAQIGFLLKGSLLQRFNTCGSAGCACHSDPSKRHGPYWQWTSKVKGKTVTRLLTDEQVRRYREWMDNARRLDEIVGELYELSAQADQLLQEGERQAPGAKRRAPRRRSRS